MKQFIVLTILLLPLLLAAQSEYVQVLLVNGKYKVLHTEVYADSSSVQRISAPMTEDEFMKYKYDLVAKEMEVAARNTAYALFNKSDKLRLSTDALADSLGLISHFAYASKVISPQKQGIYRLVSDTVRKDVYIDDTGKAFDIDTTGQATGPKLFRLMWRTTYSAQARSIPAHYLPGENKPFNLALYLDPTRSKVVFTNEEKNFRLIFKR